MIDIHNHLLYGMDDGAKSFEDSVKMCIDAKENGIDVVVCTPHFFDYSRYFDFIETRNRRVERLRDYLKDNDIDLCVLTGAELFLSDRVFSMGNLDDITLNESRYMLCEFPLGSFSIHKGIEWINELINRDYVPVVAHPERYKEFYENPEIINELLKMGVLFQVNMNSMAGHGGGERQERSVSMVKERQALIIATDAHSPVNRNTRIRELIPQIPNHISSDIMKKCVIKYPDLILRDENVFNFMGK